jgi:hypothetical protein
VAERSIRPLARPLAYRPSSDISNSKFVAEKQTLVKRPVTVSIHGGPEAVATGHTESDRFLVVNDEGHGYAKTKNRDFFSTPRCSS